MNKKGNIVIIILAIIVTIILIFFANSLWNVYQRNKIEKHNTKIDYSCNINEDCIIKDVGCDICYGLKKGCVNKNSVEGRCFRVKGAEICEAFTPPPISCTCENNKCIAIRGE